MTLTLDKILNSLIYKTLSYINIYGTNKLSKTVRFLAHPVLQIIYVISEENKLLPPYPPHLKNVTALPCKMHFFIWLKVCCIPPNVGGSEKNRLWCAANGMSGKQRHKCSKWPPSAWIHASSLFLPLINCIIHRALLKFSHVATRHFHNSPVSRIGTRLVDTREKMEKDEKYVHFTSRCGDTFQVWWVRE